MNLEDGLGLDADVAVAASGDQADEGADVAEVSAEGDDGMILANEAIVRGVEVDPVEVRAINDKPSVALIGSDQAGFARGRLL